MLRNYQQRHTYADNKTVEIPEGNKIVFTGSTEETYFIYEGDTQELELWVEAEKRLVFTTTYDAMLSPDGNHNLMVDNTGAFYDGAEIVTAADYLMDRIISPSTDDILQIDNTTLSYYDGTNWRMIFTPTGVNFYSPDVNSVLKLENEDLNYNDGTRDRLEIDGIGTTLRSTTGAYMTMLSNTFLINDNTRNRLAIDPDGTILYSDEGALLMLIDDWFNFNDGTRTRLNIGNANAAMYSPDGSKYLNITNAFSKFVGDAVCGSQLTVNGITNLNSMLDFRFTDGKGTIQWHPDVGNRSGWIGFGSSGNYDMAVRNESPGRNLILDATGGIIVCQTAIKGEGGFQASNGAAGVTGVMSSTQALSIRNGLVIAII